MCVPSVSTLCADIEAKAKDADFSGLDEKLSELKEVHPKVVEILKSF